MRLMDLEKQRSYPQLPSATKVAASNLRISNQDVSHDFVGGYISLAVRVKVASSNGLRVAESS